MDQEPSYEDRYCDAIGWVILFVFAMIGLFTAI